MKPELCINPVVIGIVVLGSFGFASPQAPSDTRKGSVKSSAPVGQSVVGKTYVTSDGDTITFQAQGKAVETNGVRGSMYPYQSAVFGPGGFAISNCTYILTGAMVTLKCEAARELSVAYTINKDGSLTGPAEGMYNHSAFARLAERKTMVPAAYAPQVQKAAPTNAQAEKYHAVDPLKVGFKIVLQLHGLTADALGRVRQGTIAQADLDDSPVSFIQGQVYPIGLVSNEITCPDCDREEEAAGAVHTKQFGDLHVRSSGNLALEFYMTDNQVKAIQDFLAVEHRASAGHCEICEAAGAGDLATVRTLLKGNSALAKAKDRDSSTALHWAVHHKEVVELLLATGADVNAKDVNSDTPLQRAALLGDTETVKLLLAGNADVNTKDIIGASPLHGAATNGYKDIVELLLAKGADVNLTNNNGETPLRIATKYRRNEVAELLRQHGGHE